MLSTGGACNGSLGQNKTQWYSGDRVGPRCHARVSYCRVCSCWVLVIYFHEALESAIICIAFIMLYLTCRLFVLIFWSLPMFDEDEEEVFFGLFATCCLGRHVCPWDVWAYVPVCSYNACSVSVCNESRRLLDSGERRLCFHVLCSVHNSVLQSMVPTRVASPTAVGPMVVGNLH